MTSKRWKVIIPDRVSGSVDEERAVFGDSAEIIALNAKTNDEMLGRIEEADAILAWHDLDWNSKVLGSLKNCKAIVRVGTGFDNVDIKFAKEKGIVVSNVPDYGTLDVADHTIAMMLSLARGLNGHNTVAKKGKDFWKWGLIPTFRLTNKTLGIIGLGRIGAATALRAKAFGLNVIFYDPYKSPGWDKTLGLTRVETLDELATQSDIISFHVPLSPDTRAMASESFFSKCKKGVVLINTARGPIIEWKAFLKYFENRTIEFAAFDVLPTEPIDLTDALLNRWSDNDQELESRLLISPHCAFHSSEAIHEMRTKAAQEALRILQGKTPYNRVN